MVSDAIYTMKGFERRYNNGATEKICIFKTKIVDENSSIVHNLRLIRRDENDFENVFHKLFCALCFSIKIKRMPI